MPGGARVLRASGGTLGQNRISLFRLSAHYSAYLRNFHVSQTALKRRGKAVLDEALFDEKSESEADELFSSKTPVTRSRATPTPTGQSSKPEPLLRGRVSPSQETDLVDEKAAEELRQKEEKRREAFQSNYEYLQGRTGDAGKNTSTLPTNQALHTLIQLAVSQEEWQKAIRILRQWRRYPARPIPAPTHQVFIERAASTGHVPLVVNILTHHPVYGIHIASLPLARALLKDVVTPVNSRPPSETDPKIHCERLEQALQLSQVFSISTVQLPPEEIPVGSDSPSEVPEPTTPIGTRKSLTLSPCNDLLLGCLLFTALLRVATHPPLQSSKAAVPNQETPTPRISTDPTAIVQAIHELFASLQSSYRALTQPSHAETEVRALSGKETLWVVAALSECAVLLGGKSGRTLFEKFGAANVAESERGKAEETMGVDEMVVWLVGVRDCLVQDASARGGVIRGKIGNVLAQNGEKETTAQKGVEHHLLGNGDGGTGEMRV